MLFVTKDCLSEDTNDWSTKDAITIRICFVPSRISAEANLETRREIPTFSTLVPNDTPHLVSPWTWLLDAFENTEITISVSQVSKLHSVRYYFFFTSKKYKNNVVLLCENHSHLCYRNKKCLVMGQASLLPCSGLYLLFKYQIIKG